MKRVVLVWALVALGVALGAGEVGVVPRKHNWVSSYLEKVVEELQKKNLTTWMEVVELGEEVGRLRDVTVGVVGEVRTRVDGIRKWGFELDGEVEAIAVGGRYELLYLDVPMLFPFFGEGRFSVLLEGVGLGVNLEASYDFSKDGFDIELPRLELSVRSAKVNFENLMNDPSVADFLNQLISDLTPDLLKMLSDTLLQQLKPVVAKYANDIILCVKKEFLNGNSKVKECIENLFKPPPQAERLLHAAAAALAAHLPRALPTPPPDTNQYTK